MKTKHYLETLEETFNFLKRHGRRDFGATLKNEKIKWSDVKDMEPILEILEREMKIENQYRKEHLSKNGKKTYATTNISEIGAQNLKKLTSTREHQQKASKAGLAVRKKINEERLNSLITFMIENLPQEFSNQDICDLRNNNLDNTLFHRSHKKAIPMTENSLIRKFLSHAKDMKLIVQFQCGNQHRPNLYHIINTLDSINVSSDSYESILEHHFGS